MTAARLIVQRCGADGVDPIHRLHRDCFDPRSGEYWRRPDLQRVFGQRGVAGYLATPDGDGRALGYALVRCLQDEAEILSLGVAKAARRQGVARQLLREMVTELAGRGIRYVFLEVRENNMEARDLYSREGFHVVGRRSDYYLLGNGQRIDGLTMLLNTQAFLVHRRRKSGAGRPGEETTGAFGADEKN